MDMKRIGYTFCLVLVSSASSWLQAADATDYKQLRYNESYLYLCDPARHSDCLDPIKLIKLSDSCEYYLSLGGEIRERYEIYHNSLWGRGPQDGGGYLLQRYMVHADTHLGEHARFFLQFKSGLETGRNSEPRPTDRDEFDLHQAFLEIAIPLSNKGGLAFRLGRQELVYGSSRLISFREGPNVRSSFDGAKFILKLSHWQVDGFAVKPVQTKTGVFDDAPDRGQGFWGIYTVTPFSWLPGGNLDFYYLGLDRENAHFNQGAAHERRHTLGTRIWGNKADWDYNFELVYQFGKFGDADIQAWTAASDTGFTFTRRLFKPRLGMRANITSGDKDPAKSDLQTFNPLFPKGAYFGEPALIGPANHTDIHPQMDLTLRPNLGLSLDWDCFWRTSIKDGIYGPAVNLIQPSLGSNARYIGNQVEAMMTWSINRHLSWYADYAHFFAGAFLKQTTPGKDVDYLSMWMTYRF